jgi:hypothetical protein
VKIPLITDDDQGSVTDEWLEWDQLHLTPQLAKNADVSALLQKVEDALQGKQYLVGVCAVYFLFF